MIERRWHGKVPQHLGKDFFQYLIDTGVGEIIQLSGNLGARILKNEKNGWVHFEHYEVVEDFQPQVKA